VNQISSSSSPRVARSRGAERRAHRRHSPASAGLPVGFGEAADSVGTIVDLSAGGCQLRTQDASIRPGDRVKVSITLPEHAGLSPFARADDGEYQPACEWQGTLHVARRGEAGNGSYSLGGQLLDMTPVDRGMLGLYLSTQPLAA
jgi:hypothetical protein